MHGRGHYCSRAKHATPLNIKLSVARRSASADDGSQMSTLLATVAGGPTCPICAKSDDSSSCFRDVIDQATQNLKWAT